jgi:hypothetical protein
VLRLIFSALSASFSPLRSKFALPPVSIMRLSGRLPRARHCTPAIDNVGLGKLIRLRIEWNGSSRRINGDNQ